MADALTLAALRALVSYSDPQIAPDGTRVAYVRSTQDFRASKNRHAIVIADVATGRTTTVDAGPDVGVPRWAPDGARIAYLRHDAKHDEDQIVVSSPGARTTTVTHAPNGVQQYAWSPSGARLAYVTPNDEPNAAAAKRKDDLFTVGDDAFTTTKPAAPSHLWLVGSDGRGTHRLTRGAWTVYEGVAPFVGGSSDPSWSADGRTIAVAIAPDAHDAATDRSTIGLVDVATGTLRRPIATDHYVYFPSYAPDGDRLAYLRPHGPGPVSVMDAHVIGGGAGGGARSIDRDLTSLAWGGDGWLFGIANDHARSRLYAVPTAPQQLFIPALRAAFRAPNRSAEIRGYAADLGSLNVLSFSVARRSGRIAFVGSSSARAPEVYVLGRGDGTPLGAAPKHVTDENARIDALVRGRVEHVTWNAGDGQTSDGLLVHPVGEQRGKKYPLLIWHHGGPEAAIVDDFTEGTDEGYPIGQFAAARGWYTFLPNYRGSDDLGSVHEHAIFGDPGEGPMRDVMAGIDAIGTTASIDEHRICIGGHSYGGFMTAWIIGHDTRWTCAVVADGAVDWMQAYALSGTGNLAWTRDSLGGTPADPETADLYRTGSPLSYAGAVKTPTLIITGLNDEVVPWTESWTYYHALKDRGVKVRLVGIPTAHHTPRDPVRHEAYERTILDWLRSYLR